MLFTVGQMTLLAYGSPEAFVSKKYPDQSIVASCSGTFVDRKNDTAIVIHDSKKKIYRVLWVSNKGDIRELDTIPIKSSDKFELQCNTPKKAAEIKKTLEMSEGFHEFLKFPKGHGILCYFTDYVTSKCWTFDRQQNQLVDAGGWET